MALQAYESSRCLGNAACLWGSNSACPYYTSGDRSMKIAAIFPVLVLFASAYSGSVLAFDPSKPGQYSDVNQNRAAATCAALNTGRWSFAVPRRCATVALSCNTICSSLSNVDPQVPTLIARYALNLYVNNRPATSVHSLGLKTYVYTDTSAENCGPNYCCCTNP